MSCSEQDTVSECSNTMEQSPEGFPESPYSSPSQQVPQLTNCLNILSCADDMGKSSGKKPFLVIVEQPQNHFRFRYKSEMVGTHGCLLGKSYANNKTKTHPSVELVNYSGQALVRCRLAHYPDGGDHPHQLLEEEQDRDVSAEVGPEKGYKVRFPGMGIIHTAKKDVPGLLFKKCSEQYGDKPFDAKQLRTRCDNIAKNINLNIVCLKFTAHDLMTEREICSPVLSDPIHNMKSAATNDLKICRMSKVTGLAKGGEDVFIFVEKVNKKNIEVRFVELSSTGEVAWSDKARFNQNDVHHQYGIVFRTPAYKNPQTPIDVQVYVELLRPSDGRSSERMEFTYKADYMFKQSKKRKANSYSSIESSTSGSIKSISELPVTVLNHPIDNYDEQMQDLTLANNNLSYNMNPYQGGYAPLAEALFEDTALAGVGGALARAPANPLLSQPNVPEAPPIELNSAEFRGLHSLLKEGPLQSGDIRDFCENFHNSDELRLSYCRDGLNMQAEESHEISNSMDLFSSSINLVLKTDSCKKKGTPVKTASIAAREDFVKNIQSAKTNVKDRSNDSYSALYNKEDGAEVKKEEVMDSNINYLDIMIDHYGPFDSLVKELCDIIRNKAAYKKNDAKVKLERLFEKRLSNGDTFLHMTLCNNILPSMEFIVKLIHQLKMTHLLNLENNQGQTILHLAIMSDLLKYIPFLISKGCDPMVEDNEGHNAIHYAVMYQTGLAELLSAIKANNVPCDLNAYNNEKQTALHVAAVSRLEGSARLLLAAGAAAAARDAGGRGALHLAAYDDCLGVLRELLRRVPANQIDVTDGQGNTALQIVCGGQLQKNSYDIAKLLLEHGADPLKCGDKQESSWKLTCDKPEIRALMKTYLPSEMDMDEEVKSEPEDEFELADDGDYYEMGMQEMPQYIRQLSDILDSNGEWKELAVRLKCDSLLNWYEKTPSPTQTLLMQIKGVNERFTSRSLAMTLKDMGQIEAANLILHCIRD